MQKQVAKAIIDAPRSFGGKKIGASGLRVELIGENALDHERLWVGANCHRAHGSC